MKGSSFISRLAAASAAVIFTASTIQAAGFSIYEASASGNALGGAVVGKALDASTVAYNPAAMTDLPGLQLLGGVTMISAFGDVDVTGSRATTMHQQYFWMPHAYATWQMTDRLWFGFGVFSEFGLGTEYYDNWDLAYSSVKTDLQTITFNPNLAYKITDDLSIALGMRIMWVDFSNTAQPYNGLSGPASPYFAGAYGSKVDVEADDIAFGWNGAVKYDLTDEWSFGFVYRSPTWVHAEGNADGYGGAFTGGHQYSRADATITLPAAYTVGANYVPTESRWYFGATVTYTEWSSYNALNINLDQPLRTTMLGGQAPIVRIWDDKDWKDVFRFGVGAQYKITDNLAARAGYVYDLDPIDQAHCDTMMLPGDRHIASIGLSYTWKNFTFDASYSYLFLMSEKRTVIGKLDGQVNGAITQRNTIECEDMGAHLVGFSVGYKF